MAAKFRNYCLIDDLGGTVRVSIIIPTYNESLNIKRLLDNIYDENHAKGYEKRDIQMNVLVVDDNSPDGTSEIVKEYQKHNPFVHLLIRQNKEGLGAAYIHGMNHSLSTLRPHILFEMDADLSHNPKYILPMIDKIRAGADFVIGSRYIKGGSIPSNWGVSRKMISRSANVYARLMLGLRSVNDCTGGYRAIRASLLRRIDLDSLNIKGYVFQISLLNQVILTRGDIREVPIAFEDRTNGSSKMKFSDVLELGMVVLRLSVRKNLMRLTQFSNPNSGVSSSFANRREQIERNLIRY
jgi:dolichol-phosphate mannosyltransferase